METARRDDGDTCSGQSETEPTQDGPQNAGTPLQHCMHKISKGVSPSKSDSKLTSSPYPAFMFDFTLLLEVVRPRWLFGL